MIGRLKAWIGSRIQVGEARPWWFEVLVIVDGLLALGVWMAFRALEWALRIRTWLTPGPFAWTGRVVFVTNEPFTLPAARIRCGDMADFLRRDGLDAEVFSFGERFFRLGREEFFTRLSDSQKMVANLRALWAFRRERGSIFVSQRAHYQALSVAAAAYALGSPVILDLDDYDWMRRHPNGFKFLHRFAPFDYSVLARRMIRGAAACVVSSQRLFEHVAPRHPRTVLIPTGVRPDRFPARPPRREEPTVFSWIGTLFHRENFLTLEALVAAFLAIESPRPRRLDIVGGGPWLDVLQRQLAGQERVRVRGWIPPDDVPAYLATVDVGLFPLFERTEFARCKSPTKLFEYMASRRAVIASRLGEAERIIRDGENGLLADTIEDFGRAMRRLVEDPAMRESLAERGLATVEADFLLPALARRYAALIRSVGTGGGAGRS